MDKEKSTTLDQVRDSLEIVESARADQTLSPAEKFKLEKASVQLRNLERSIIVLEQQELVASLKTDSVALNDLSIQISDYSEKLSKVAGAIAKATKVVDILIQAVSAAGAAGII